MSHTKPAYGFIFDLDGVLTDTAEYHYWSWQRLADEEGLAFSREDNEALRGVSRRRSLEILLKGKTLPESVMEDYMARKNAYYLEDMERLTPADLLPGAGQFLAAARAEGIVLGLASASKNARMVCERLGILDLFRVIGDGYSVVNAKPAPDLFVWVAGGLGLNPKACTVFEDAEMGIAVAQQGGFYTVGIGPAERVGAAHQISTGLHELTPQQCLAPR